jgi:hypothetical protein
VLATGYFNTSANVIFFIVFVPGWETFGKLVVTGGGLEAPNICGALPKPLEGSKPETGFAPPTIGGVLPNPYPGFAAPNKVGGVLPNPFVVSKAVTGLFGIADEPKPFDVSKAGFWAGA